MSLREELHKVVSDVFAGKDVTEESFNFLYDHGQALLEAVEDAERYRSLTKLLYSEWLIVGEAEIGMRVMGSCPSLDDINQAIDDRSKTVDGGGA